MPVASRHDLGHEAYRPTIKGNRNRKVTSVIEAASLGMSGGGPTRRRGLASQNRQKPNTGKLVNSSVNSPSINTSSLFNGPPGDISHFASTSVPSSAQGAFFSRPVTQSDCDGMATSSFLVADMQHDADCHPPSHQSATISPGLSSTRRKTSIPVLSDVVQFVMRVHRLDPYHLKLVWIYGGNSWNSHSRALKWVEDFIKNNRRLPMDVSLKKEGRSKGGVACVKCTFRDCGRSFPEVQSAAEHIVSKHIGAVKWRCTFPGCNKEYNHSYDLKRHHQTKHGVKLPQRGRRRHDIPMISASDVEFSASSSPFDYTMSSPSIFSNSPARHAISITPKSDSLSLKSPQTKTSAENQLTGLPLAAEFPPSFWDFLQPDNLNSAQGPQTTPSLGRQVDSLDSFSTTFSGVPNHLTGRALYPPTQLHFPKCRCAHDALHAAGHIFPDYSPMLASMMLSNGYDPTGGEIQSALPSPRMQPSQTNVLFGGTDPTLSGPNSTYLQPYLGNLPPFIDMTIQRPKQSNDSSESSTLTATAQHPDASWSLQPSLLTWYRSVGERQNLDACSFEGFPSDGLDLSGSQGTSDLSWLSPRTSQENEGMSLEDILNDHAPAPFTRGRM